MTDETAGQVADEETREDRIDRLSQELAREKQAQEREEAEALAELTKRAQAAGVDPDQMQAALDVERPEIVLETFVEKVLAPAEAFVDSINEPGPPIDPVDQASVDALARQLDQNTSKLKTAMGEADLGPRPALEGAVDTTQSAFTDKAGPPAESAGGSGATPTST